MTSRGEVEGARVRWLCREGGDTAPPTPALHYAYPANRRDSADQGSAADNEDLLPGH